MHHVKVSLVDFHICAPLLAVHMLLETHKSCLLHVHTRAHHTYGWYQQATAGSAGVLIIENNVLVEGTDAPDEYLTMPEAVMMIMEMAPDRTRQVAELSKDPLYECGTYNTFFLVRDICCRRPCIVCMI
jgi:hypothetical protein